MRQTLILLPSGRLIPRAEHGEDDQEPDSWTKRIIRAFSTSQAAGLFALAATRPEVPPSPSFRFWREFACRYLTELCRTPEGNDSGPIPPLPRDPGEREFARKLGATWAGDITDRAPEELAAVIDTTPVWKPVVQALANLAPGGRLVINAIRKEDVDKDQLTRLDYPAHLWMEKEIKSVANVARRDVTEFLRLAAEVPIRPTVETFPLEEANKALVELKERRIRGAKVLVVS